MKVVTHIVMLGALVLMLLIACSPNSLLIDVQQKVQEAQAAGTQTVNTPIFSPTTGTYSSDQSVTITDATAGAAIHCTSATAGAIPPDPTADSPVYSLPIAVAVDGTTMTIKAIATKSGMNNSSIVLAVFTINYGQVSTPQFSPLAGGYNSDQTVIISTGTAGASIRYSTDGSAPTSIVGTLYSEPVNVAVTEKLSAIAYKTGMTDSTVATATYTLLVSVPTFSLAVGSYMSAQTATMSTTTTDASIRYTTDGSTPTSTTGTLYSGQINIATSQTLKAIAYKTGWADSDVRVASYVIFPQYFVYVANQTSSSVSAYNIHTDNGALSVVSGSPFTGVMGPAEAAIDPTGGFAYVAANSGNAVSAFAVNPTNGALLEISSSPFTAGTNPSGIAIVPGKFVYVANFNSNNISAYKINTSTGALSAVSGSPYSAGTSPNRIAVDPTGKFAYVANYNSGNVSAYKINQSTGALTAVSGSPFAAAFSLEGIVVEPTGKYVYVVSGTGIYAYSINASTGALTAVSGSPFWGGLSAGDIAVDPSGKFVYAANYTHSNVCAFTINTSTGALAAVNGMPFSSGAWPEGIAVDPTGTFVYVTTYTNTGSIYAYTINTVSGALSPISGSPFDTGPGAWGIAIAKIAGP